MSFILAGLMLGFYAGFVPGPTLTLVLFETLRHGTRAGFQVALSPLITDLPIVALALLIVGQLSKIQAALGVISLVGACVLLWMGYESLRTQAIDLSKPAKAGDSLKRGMIVNWLNPHPYLFWLPVGAPLVYRAAQHSWWAVVGFLLAFYLLLVGSKVVLALVAGHFREFLSGKLYLTIVRGLGLALWVFAGLLAWEGWHLLVSS